jgi:hypothetical protein
MRARHGPGMNRRTFTAVAGALLLLVVSAAGWLWIKPHRGGIFAFKEKPGAATSTTGGDQASSSATAAALRLDAVLAQLESSRDATVNRATLADLRKFLNSLAPEAASREVRAFLDTGKNADTALDFTVEAGGGLGDSPSLRVFLLDYLGRIDKTAAGKVAGQILSRYTTPDEWAVCLRNYAWAHPDADAYLRDKARKHLANTEWRKNPGTGYLEAFDAVVYTRATELAPQLAGMVCDTENKALAHAAYLTLDRLAISDPATVLGTLLKDPGLMKGREQTRANYFARADLSDPKQKTLVERYLTDSGRSVQELDTFAGIFPNQNYMISNNLLTGMETPNQAGIAQRDRAALEMVDKWLADPRFQKVQPQLKVIKRRLQTFVNQAQSPP